MSRSAESRSNLNQQVKSVVSYGADLVEWSAEKNLAVAADFASFAVAQIRLPIEVQDFAEYRAELRGSFSGFGETLQEHGQDYMAKIRDLPGEFRKVFDHKFKQSSAKTAVKKKATKKAAVKKAA